MGVQLESDENNSRMTGAGIYSNTLFFNITIVNTILGHNILNFPYIILTIYFFISVFTFPVVSIETGEKTKNWPSRYVLIFAYVISPIWVTVNIFKNSDKERS